MEDIGAVAFCQWCFAPLRGYAIDKSQQLRFRVVKQSNLFLATSVAKKLDHYNYRSRIYLTRF